ncbi:MAG: cob(I)yrinic acid a,c-diamide adenosyltransferase [Spirochaetales bacterium]|nr:cob(I)yrinic acid a,c-diamide adenosyltransferase [Spirochaetales bacterium]
MNKGYLQVYTGDGKGKTTASMGLTVRALGGGMRVYFGQFLKNNRYSEIKTLEKLAGDALKIRQFGTKRPVLEPMNEEDFKAALAGIEEAEREMESGIWDLMVLDEFNIVAGYKLVKQARLEAFLDKKPEGTELVLTGRSAPEWLIERADLVTEMKLIKHYFDAGVPARKGIES